MVHRPARFALAVALVLVFLAAPAFAQVKLNYSIFFPASHRNSVLATEWAQRGREARPAARCRSPSSTAGP